MAKKHKYTATFDEIGQLFEEAADTGTFEFDIAPYEDFVAFIKEHSPNFKMQMGKREPEFVEELRRLSQLAYNLDKQ